MSNPECRNEVAAWVDEDDDMELLSKVNAKVSSALQQHKVTVDSPTVSFLEGLCHDLILMRDFDESLPWTPLLTLVLTPFAADISTLVSALNTQLSQGNTMTKKYGDDDT